MAPSAIYERVAQQQILQVENAPFFYRNDTLKKPVADDFMYAFKYNFPLPTHDSGADVLDFTEDDETNKRDIAERFLKELEQVIQSRDSKAFADLFLDSGEYGEVAQGCRDPEIDENRGVEGQGRFHLGLPLVQHSEEHRTGRF
jgi:hypothetical protein